MKKLMVWMAAVAAVPSLFAQDITGTWQGTLTIPQANRDLRTVVKISKDDGHLKALFYSIDQGGQSVPVNPITVEGSAVKMTIPGIGGSYEAKLDADGTSMTGTFKQGPAAFPLNLKHVTGDAEWEIPKPAAAPKAMPADADPSFEVATIKPSKPGAVGKGLIMRDPRTFMTINYSVADLISFAYGVHLRQVTGAPGWIETEKYDIQATPEPAGLPNRNQIAVMVQKLLTDRFQLKFHHDKKELSVYAITVAKGGPKLTPSTADPNGLPGLGFGGLGRMNARNANMSDLAQLFQSTVLDRPVIDQSGLKGRFDFQLIWTPDESQFLDMRGQLPPQPKNGDEPPDLFAAMQQQLGLKLDPVKTSVDVLVIDRVEKPSAN